MKTVWTLFIILAAVATNGCHKYRAIPPGNASSLPSGEVRDSIGDAIPDNRIPRAPDLVQGTAAVQNGNITFTVRLAPGTFDPATTLLMIYLHTDNDPSTGIAIEGDTGVDHLVSLGRVGTPAYVQKYTTAWNSVGTVPKTFTIDGADVTVPLSMLGDSNGRLDYRVSSFNILPGSASATGIIVDSMPDRNLPARRVQ